MSAAVEQIAGAKHRNWSRGERRWLKREANKKMWAPRPGLVPPTINDATDAHDPWGVPWVRQRAGGRG